MIAGVGVDLCQVGRMTKSLESPAFWQRVFGPEEQQQLTALGEKKRCESAAADFAAKEAFLKAAGRGLGGFALQEIQAIRGQDGAPRLCLSGMAAAWMKEKALCAHLSLTHEGGLAEAFVILEQASDKACAADCLPAENWCRAGEAGEDRPQP